MDLPPNKSGSLARLKTWLERPSDPLPFLVFRSALALAIFLNIPHLLPTLKESLSSGFHLSHGAALLIGKFLLPPLPASWVLPFIVLLLGAPLALACGRLPQITAGITATLIAALLLIDPLSSSAHLKIAILALVLMAFVSPEDMKKSWPINFGRILLVSIYFLAGWRKAVFGAWFDQSQNLKWMLMGDFQTGLGAFALSIFPDWIWPIGQITVVLFQLATPYLFFKPSSRNLALLCGCAFHLMIALMLRDLAFFSMVVIAFYPLFIPASRLRAFLQFFPRFLHQCKP